MTSTARRQIPQKVESHIIKSNYRFTHEKKEEEPNGGSPDFVE